MVTNEKPIFNAWKTKHSRLKKPLFPDYGRATRLPLYLWTTDLSNSLDQINNMSENEQIEEIAPIINNLGLIFVYRSRIHDAEELTFLAINYFKKKFCQSGNILWCNNVLQPWVNLARLNRHKREFTLCESIYDSLYDFDTNHDFPESYQNTYKLVLDAMKNIKEDGDWLFVKNHQETAFKERLELFIDQDQAHKIISAYPVNKDITLTPRLISLYELQFISLMSSQNFSEAYNLINQIENKIPKDIYFYLTIASRILHYYWDIGEKQKLHEWSNRISFDMFQKANSESMLLCDIYLILNIINTASQLDINFNNTPEILIKCYQHAVAHDDHVAQYIALNQLYTIEHDCAKYSELLFNLRNTSFYHFISTTETTETSNIEYNKKLDDLYFKLLKHITN
jgi:hypothetical protein